jgi:hypothetical protein
MPGWNGANGRICHLLWAHCCHWRATAWCCKCWDVELWMVIMALSSGLRLGSKPTKLFWRTRGRFTFSKHSSTGHRNRYGPSFDSGTGIWNARPSNRIWYNFGKALAERGEEVALTDGVAVHNVWMWIWEYQHWEDLENKTILASRLASAIGLLEGVDVYWNVSRPVLGTGRWSTNVLGKMYIVPYPAFTYCLRRLQRWIVCATRHIWSIQCIEFARILMPSEQCDKSYDALSNLATWSISHSLEQNRSGAGWHSETSTDSEGHSHTRQVQDFSTHSHVTIPLGMISSRDQLEESQGRWFYRGHDVPWRHGEAMIATNRCNASVSRSNGGHKFAKDWSAWWHGGSPEKLSVFLPARRKLGSLSWSGIMKLRITRPKGKRCEQILGTGLVLCVS